MDLLNFSKNSSGISITAIHRFHCAEAKGIQTGENYFGLRFMYNFYHNHTDLPAFQAVTYDPLMPIRMRVA